jgi:cytochrome c556
MFSKKVAALTLGLLGLAGATQAADLAFQRPDDAVEYRQGAFNVISKHFGRIGAMVNGKMPFDAAVAQADADLLVTLSTLPWQGFKENTKDASSKVKPEVWSEMGKFKGGGEQMVSKLKDLQTATKSGNLETIKAAFGAAAQTCKGCHDNFRNK